MIVASVPVEILLGDAVTGTATKALVSARMRGARHVTAWGMLCLPSRARRR